MGLGTKNRQKQTADVCKQHLREKYREKLGLVEEFIVEIEGKNCDATRWGCIRSYLHKDILVPAEPPLINEGLRLINRYRRQREIDEGLRVVPSLEELDEEKRLFQELVAPLETARRNLRKLSKEQQFDPLVMAAKSQMVAELYRLADDLNEFVF
jgi:hypothetical protein